MTDDPAAVHGLRERKKQATRRALHDAALRLALDRGLDHLTVEEISAAADVSVRTFFNYYPSKEEAILGDDLFPADVEKAKALMLGAGSVLDGLQAITRSLAAEASTRPEQVRMRWQLMDRYPALLPRMFVRPAEVDKALPVAVAARTGGAPGDTYPQLMAAVTTAAMRVAVRRWTAGNGDRPLEDHMNEVFGLLGNELSAPEQIPGRGGMS